MQGNIFSEITLYLGNGFYTDVISIDIIVAASILQTVQYLRIQP